VTFFLDSLSQNGTVWRISIQCSAWCGGMLMIGCWPSRSTVSQYFKRVNLEMDSKVPIMRTWMCLLCQFKDSLARCDGAKLEI
jgi:hypothetical protein